MSIFLLTEYTHYYCASYIEYTEYTSQTKAMIQSKIFKRGWIQSIRSQDLENNYKRTISAKHCIRVSTFGRAVINPAQILL